MGWVFHRMKQIIAGKKERSVFEHPRCRSDPWGQPGADPIGDVRRGVHRVGPPPPPEPGPPEPPRPPRHRPVSEDVPYEWETKLEWIRALLSKEGMRDHLAGKWLASKNRSLGGRTPIEALEAGMFDKVAETARAFCAGR